MSDKDTSIDRTFLTTLVTHIGDSKDQLPALLQALSSNAGQIRGDDTRRAQRWAMRCAVARNSYVKAAGNSSEPMCTRYRVAQLAAEKVRGGVSPGDAVAQLVAECGMGQDNSHTGAPVNDADLHSLFGSPGSDLVATGRSRVSGAE